MSRTEKIGVATQAGEKVSNVIGPTATTAIQDIHGIAKAEGADLLKQLKSTGSSVLKKFFNANAPRPIELEARLDKALFSDKKRNGEMELQ